MNWPIVGGWDAVVCEVSGLGKGEEVLSEGGLRRQRALVDPWAGAWGSQCPRCSEQREDAGGSC